MTRRLFDEDAYCKTFRAQVLRCESTEKGWEVLLDETAFYPEGGGQPCDVGTLGEARVLEVSERAGELLHLCDRALCGTVTGTIDWERRFSHMQQHSGEHLVSGLVHNRFGYENVGFHMGAACMTIDFNGIITAQELASIERAANEAVWANLKTETLLPQREELCKLQYRSKKEISGQVRLVRFPGVDTCACCGTHVRRTGEIGLIQLLSCVRFREGVRVELLCGSRAYEYLAAIREQNHTVSGLLSAKPVQTAAAVVRLKQELEQEKTARVGLEQRLFAAFAQKHAGKESLVLLFEPEWSPDALRRLTVALMERCTALCAVFSGSDATGYKYAVGQTNGDLRRLTRELNTALQGRGGGKPFFAQGSVEATQESIRSFFAAYENRP